MGGCRRMMLLIVLNLLCSLCLKFLVEGVVV